MVGRDGRVLRRVALRAIEGHLDGQSQPTDISTMQFVVPATGARAIVIMRGHRGVARMTLPRGRLTLRRAAVRRAACRAPALLLRYRVRGPRGSLPEVLVYAHGHGRDRLIEVGARSERVIAIARGSVPRGTRRLRVRYSNGLRTVVASVPLPRACAG